MDDRLDENVIRACQKGDKAAYAVLVKRYYKSVFALCLGMVGNTHDAEDATQEALLKGFLQIKKLDRTGQYESWILQIARNLCIDLLRRRKRIRVYGRNQQRQTEPKSRTNEDLEQAIRRLPQELRVPLTMFYFELKISHSGACQRIREARRQLHELLTERTYDE